MLNGAAHAAGAIVTAIVAFGADPDILTALPYGVFASVLAVLFVGMVDFAPVLISLRRGR